MSEKNTGIWVYLSLVGIVVLTGFLAFWKQRQAAEARDTAAIVQQAQPASDPPPAVPKPKAQNKWVSDISDSTFSKEVVKSSKPVLVDFWATWCGPCRIFGPIVEQVADDYGGRLKVCRVDVDQNPQLSQAFQVRAIPTAILFKNGKVLKMWIGLVSGDDLKLEVDKILKHPKKAKLVDS